MKTIYPPKIINGYRYVYAPEFVPENKNPSYDGYVQEHRYVIEKRIGRILSDDEVVHHKDFNKLNNELSNLIVMKLCDHSLLHKIITIRSIDKTTVRTEDDIKMVLSSVHRKKCIDCGADLSVGSDSSASVVRCPKCNCIHRRIVERPSKEILEKDIYEHSYAHLETKYKVSTNAIKKWAKQYGIRLPDRRKSWIRDKEFVVTDKMIEARKFMAAKQKERFRYGTPFDRKVFQYSKDGKLISEYRSTEECARQNKSFIASVISRACNGKLKTYKGYVWKYG